MVNLQGITVGSLQIGFLEKFGILSQPGILGYNRAQEFEKEKKPFGAELLLFTKNHHHVFSISWCTDPVGRCLF